MTLEWQVRSLCAGTDSFTPIDVFRTVCNKPMATKSSLLTATSALLSWHRYGDGLIYTIRWRKQGLTFWQTYITPSASLALRYLEPGTQYEWQIRTNCTDVTGSDFTAMRAFTTLTTDDCTNGLHSIKPSAWNDPTTWSCGRIPIETDEVWIGHSVVVPVGYQAYALKTIYSTGGSLRISPGAKVSLAR